MMTANVLPVLAASATAVFVMVFPQPKDFTQAVSGRVQAEVSTPLRQLIEDPEVSKVNAMLRHTPEGSALDRLTESGCIEEVKTASPDRLAACGQLIADAMQQIEDTRRGAYPMPKGVLVDAQQTNEYLHLAAINVCRAHWVMDASMGTGEGYPACTAVSR